MDQNHLTQIKIPYPSTRNIHLKIATGICSLVIAPGLGNDLVNGKYYDPTDLAKLSIHQSGIVAQLNVGKAFGFAAPLRHMPRLTLQVNPADKLQISRLAGAGFLAR